MKKILFPFVVAILLTGCVVSKNSVVEKQYNTKVNPVTKVRLVPEKAQNESPNSYIGNVVVRWLDSNKSARDMQLLEDFAFVDNEQYRWSVPATVVINGASIPVPLWSAIGSPYVGKYRRASVVHDYYCDVQTTTWKRTHRVFYQASLVSGLRPILAKSMYSVLWMVGKKWDSPEKKKTFVAEAEKWPPEFTASDKAEVQLWTLGNVDQNSEGGEELYTAMGINKTNEFMEYLMAAIPSDRWDAVLYDINAKKDSKLAKLFLELKDEGSM